MHFVSDTSAPAHPDVLAAMDEANSGSASSYGADAWSGRARQLLSDVFETDVEVWLVSSGTAANALGLSLICPGTDAIVCHEEAHIQHDERGAVTFFTGGAQLALVGGEHARIDVEQLEARLGRSNRDFVHETPVGAVSISNLTESGAAYKPDSVGQIAEAAHGVGARLHMDGARFANAVVSTGASPADLTWRNGVEVMSFGATKNGAVGCEAVILFGEARALKGEMEICAKRGGLMPPKMRYLSAQMNAMLENGLWLDLATRANRAATKLGEALVSAGGELAHPVEGNEVFVHLPDEVAGKLDAAGVSYFHPWLDGSYRFVCAWNVTDDDIASVREALVQGGSDARV